MEADIAHALNQVIAHLKTGDQSAARSLLIPLLKAHPELEQGWYLLSFAVTEPDQQKYALHQALNINPEFEQAQKALTRLEQKPAETKPAPPPPEQPPPKDRLSEAIALMKAGNPQAARAELEEILHENRQNWQAWYLLSFVVSQPERKLAALRQSLHINPDYEKARLRLAQLEAPRPKVKPAPVVESLDQTELLQSKQQTFRATLARIGKYTLVKAASLFITVVIGVYFTIIIANLGGAVDELFRGQIAEQIAGMVMGGWPEVEDQAEKDAIIAQTIWQMEDAMGLHQPFLLRTARWLVNGLTLNLGETFMLYFFQGIIRGADIQVQALVLQRLPYTMLLVGASNLLIFIASVIVALILARKYGGVMDRIMVTLASMTSAPPWIFGVLLIVLIAGKLGWLPFPKAIDLRYAEFTPEFIRLILVQMILPVMAIFCSVFFSGVYTWRTFFLLYSREDYVEMAWAKGLSARKIERNYILRPSLPYVLTSFALMVISVWESAIALEILFFWPGIGELFLQAVGRFNTTLIVAVVVVFAYLLAITIFLLDLAYAVIDPRVRIGGNNQSMRVARARRKWNFRLSASPRVTAASRGVQPAPIRSTPARARLASPRRSVSFRTRLASFRSILREVAHYPSAIVGLIIIIALIGISIYALATIPAAEAIRLWQPHISEEGRTTYYQNPKNAMPAWVNLFRQEKLPVSLNLKTADGSTPKTYQAAGDSSTEVLISFPFDYTADSFPDEITLYIDSKYVEKLPHVSINWLTPDGREIRIGSFSAEHTDNYIFSQDERLQRKLRGQSVMEGLFTNPEAQSPAVVKGKYEIQISSLLFEQGADIDFELVLHGRLFGLAGTDHHRRDLLVALLWGAPIALAFGLLGAVLTNLFAMIIAAVGVWFGGWIDSLIQRVTEVNIILPTLPVAIMVYIMYSKSIWAILGVIVLLNIFGSTIKNYRAAFLQVRESGYIEGAQAYGARGWRIIRKYMIPRIVPVLIPQLVIMVPGYVFYEATLAYLGVSDPQLPTWGKVIYDAISNGATYQGYYYWVLEPITLLVLTGLAFALFGFALDRITNPRLREV